MWSDVRNPKTNPSEYVGRAAICDSVCAGSNCARFISSIRLRAWCRITTTLSLNKPSAISPSRFFQIFVAISLLEVFLD
jgi:hypothetical protein